eukprot:Nitzschia sp. Nitz4//scaffold23_size168460//138877//140526//NITZ4_002244-RA/size168460-processed-gene-0.273-mRNA-1//-1//CDS//3329543710//2951//frame0
MLTGAHVSAFSADLPTLASEHIRFLRKIHSLGISLSRPSNESLRRYRDLWLPLIQSLPNETLIPPPDIAWLWHCHRLAPLRYEEYLQTKFGANIPILEAKPPFSLQVSSEERGESMLSTEHFWETMFSLEPFFLPESVVRKDDDANVASNDLLLNGFDLLGSAERQGTFLWQVSGPNFSDMTFLEEGAVKYYKFLALQKVPEAKDQTLVPTYQIDLFWHTHILSNLSRYHEDCCRIMGTRLHHDDSLNDRTKGGKLDTAFEATCNLWMEQYNTEYYVEGGMYRGEPPPSYYSKDWSNSEDNGDFVTEWPVDSCNNPEANRSANVSETPDSESPMWTDLYGMTNDGELGFIPANERSNDPRFNTNPQKEGYIFGNGSRGWGYYHQTTCEAYEVLKTRLDLLIEKKEEDIEILECLSCCCCCDGRLAATRRAEEKLEILKQAREAAYDRVRLDRPNFLSKTSQKQSEKGASGKRADGGDVIEWAMLPLDYFTLAGGCGATTEIFEGAACGGGVGGFDGGGDIGGGGGGFDAGGFDAGGFDAGGIDLGGFSF